jgi:serine/threonine protein kinase
MPAPATADEFLDHLRVSALVREAPLREYLDGLREQQDLPAEPKFLAGRFVRDGVLTSFQAQQLLQGRYRNFIVGRYKLLQPLGAGGMSKVFLCEHVEMGHRVAMKVLARQRGTDPELLARFLREARVAGALNHPNVVRSHDIDSSGGEIHYIIMDFVDGIALDALTRRRGRLKPDHAAHYITQAACGLQYVHDAGLLHRDIKPGNLLVDRTGVVKILDLGLARLQQDQEKLTAKYSDGAILGTADFIAPEQSLIGGEVDHRADLYSLGCTLYYLLMGRPPFTGNIAEKLIGHQSREPEPLSGTAADTPVEVQRVMRKMMAKKPRDRYQSAAEVVRDLANWLEADVPPPDEDELPRLGRAALGSSHRGIKLPLGGRFLAAARTATSDMSPAAMSAPRRVRWPRLALTAAVLAIVAAAVTWLIVTRAGV